MAKVTLEKLRKVYAAKTRDPFVAVKDIDLEIRDKEFMVLVGPSGCGKSTTLRMVAGLEEISGGRCLIGDRVVNDVPPKARDIAMVFQNYALYPHMTVFDNMAFGLKLQGLPKQEIEARVRGASEILGIETLLKRKPKALSGGQRQRVAVGRAIVRKPKVFLFDEPLSNLDAKMRVSMRTEIAKLHARLEATMIYVTHDQVEAMTMGDRICVMKDGHIMQVDEPLKLYREPRNMFVAGFIGSPPTNFLWGTIVQADGRQCFEETNAARPPVRIPLDDRMAAKSMAYTGREIVFGIRPEAIADADLDPRPGLTATATAVVEVSEPMGAETYLYLQTGGHSIIAKVGASERYDPGREVRLHFNLQHAHFFDPATEKVI